MLHLWENAPLEFRDELKRLETKADKCEFGLAIYNYPVDLATWGVLSQFVLAIEKAIQESGHGSKGQRATMMNLGKCGPIALRWLRKHCKPESGEQLRWTKKLREAAFEVQEKARNYFHFLLEFPMWYKNRLLAEIAGPNTIRFISPVENNQRRVRAYQQGHRIQGWPTTPDQPLGTGLIEDPEVTTVVANVFEASDDVGFLGFTYPQSSRLLLRLREIFLARLDSTSRWPQDVQLAGYTLEELRAFYATLQALCCAHDHLCFRWMQKHKRYPVNSGVLVKRMVEWKTLLTEISGLDQTAVDQILSDLTFGRTGLPDMYIHPFIPVGKDDLSLCLVPQFPTNSNAEENILGVFSRTHPSQYSQLSKGKEDAMRKDLEACNPHGFSITGPISLPGTLPDIDLMVEDVTSSTLVIAELKWFRKAVRSLDHISRDAKLLYGVEQLSRIQLFVNDNPGHLLSLGASKRSIMDYARVEYLLVARDHLVWIPAKDNKHIVAYDAFKKMLLDHADLRAGLSELLTYDWLPLEGRDFDVRYEYSEANEVRLESEMYYPFGSRYGPTRSA